MTEILFGSDNQAGVSPEVMEAMLRCNEGVAVAYGDDVFSARLNAAFSEVFEHEVYVFSAATGTAANALGLAAITPPYGETICHEASHIFTTEGGAPEFYAGGSRLVAMPGTDGRIALDDLRSLLQERTRPSRHHFACSSLSLTQATEFGTLYSVDQIEALSAAAHDHGLRVHMDGARFANALAALGTSPAAMSWRAGIDVLSLGTTKNGTMNAEAVLVFDPAMARDLSYRQKRAGLLTSKMRYVSAQLLAFLENDLWLRNAGRANVTARAVAGVLESVAGVRLVHPAETNQIFAVIPSEVAALLDESGIRFRSWDHQRPTVHRLVASFQDDDSKIARLKAALGPAIGGGAA